MDDTCTALPRGLVTSFQEHLNNIDKNVQFTVEEESDGRLPFLDVLMTREEDGTISTSVYRKPTHTDQYLAFKSHHPMAHKRAVVRTLMHRAETLFSSGVSRAQEEKRVQDALEKNGYPTTFVHFYIDDVSTLSCNTAKLAFYQYIICQPYRQTVKLKCCQILAIQYFVLTMRCSVLS